MGRYHPLDCKQVKNALKAMGFEPRPRTGTSHEKWVKTIGDQRFIVTVDCPKQPFGQDLISSMAKQAGVSKSDFYKYALA